MYDLNISGYRPVRGAQAVESTPEPRKGTASTAEPEQSRDTASVSGRSQSAHALGAEPALARLLELGVLENASRPVAPGEPPTPTAELTVRLDGDAEENAAGASEAEAGAAPSPATEEWRPYQPPVAMEAPPQTVSADGRSVTMTLYAAADGAENGLLLELGGVTIPLNADGTLLAGFLDGSFRMLTLDQEMLAQFLTAGLASLALNLLPEEAAEELPAEFPELPLPPEQETQPGQSAQQQISGARPDGAENARFAPPPAATGETPPFPVTRQALSEARAALSPELPQNAGTRSAPLPENKPGGALEWAADRAAEQSFRKAAENILRQSGDPWKPEALKELRQLRQEWTATAQRGAGIETPARSGAPLTHGQTSGAETAEMKTAAFGETATRTVPAGQTTQAVPVSAAPAGADAAQENALRFLRSVLTAAQPANPETAALLKSAFLTDDVSLLRKDDSGTLTRRVSEYLSQLLGGELSANTREQAELLDLPQEPQRREDELEKAWKRRQIAFEVDSAWTGNLKQWLLHVDGWRVSQCRDYINDRTDEWTTGLMQDQPARFRQWLSSPLRYAASTGWYNGATGSFPIETLPRGFTDEDFRRWVQWDVLDYL